MCGLTGIVYLDDQKVDADVLRRMTDIQRHRGPDDQGFYVGNLKTGQGRQLDFDEVGPISGMSFGVGFNRLSILDLSLAGHQPMVSADGSIIIAFNGEVYNAFDEVVSLKAAGYNFVSRTDTEVVLNMYQHFGLSACLERLNGMFAICIIDLNKSCIWLVRDRLGIKPLYFWRSAKCILFTSEIKSLLEHDEFQARLHSETMHEHLTFRYISGYQTLLKDVYQVEPGQVLQIKSDGSVHQSKYWSIPEGTALPMGKAEALDQLDSQLAKSVSMQMLSDVRVGSQLSGGIDSSLVTLFAAKSTQGDLDTISIIFDDDKYSEEKWVDEVHRVQPMRSHKFNLTAGDFLETLRAATWHFDHPLNHPNSIGIWFIAREAQKYVSVLISGEGADEVFGGYSRFAPAGLYRMLAPFIPLFGSLTGSTRRRSAKWSAHVPLSSTDLFLISSAALDPVEATSLLSDYDPNYALESRRAVMAKTGGNFITRCMNYEAQTFLPDVLLRQDKMTMAHSIESRVPYLDHVLLELVRKFPSKYNVKSSISKRPDKATKMLLKSLALKYFGPEFVYRRKSGFGLPLSEYFSDPRFICFFNDAILPGTRRRGIINSTALEESWKLIQQGYEKSTQVLWVGVAFELWCQAFLDYRSR